MSNEPLHLPLRVISEVNAALVAGHKAAEALHDQQMKGPEAYSKEIHKAAMAAQDACMAFDMYVMRKLPTIEMTVAE